MVGNSNSNLSEKGIYCYLVSVHSILLLSEVKVNDGEEALTHDPLLKTLTKMLRNIRTKKSNDAMTF